MKRIFIFRTLIILMLLPFSGRAGLSMHIRVSPELATECCNFDTEASLSASAADVYMNGSSGSTGTFYIYSDVSWTIEETNNATWMQISQTSGTGDATITLTATSANPDNWTRTGVLKISAPGCEDVTVYGTQLIYKQLEVSAVDVYMDQPAGSSNTFEIYSNIDWSIDNTNNDTWINISPTSGSGDATITLTANTANPNTWTRTAVLTISGTGAEDAIVYGTQYETQSKYLDLTTTSLSLEENSGANATFGITSNTSWNITDNATWLSVSPGSGSDNATITVTANSANSTGSTRSATITISGSGCPDKYITVNQDTESYLSVSPDELTLDPESGANATFLLSSNTSWSISDDATWLSVSPGSGSSNATITATANSANSTGSTRSATITISATGCPDVYVSVSQNSDISLSVSPEEMELDPESGANDILTITSNTSWSVSDNASWLDLSASSGTNNGTITVSANSENTGPDSRTAIVTVSASGLPSETVNVTQLSAPFLTLSTDELNLDQSSGSFNTITIQSNVSWSIDEQADWMTVSPSSGSGNATVTFTASSENPDTESRSVVATLSGPGVGDQELTIYQGGTGPFLDVNPQNLDLEQASGSSSSFIVSSNIEWTVTNTADWLDVSPVTGSNTGTVNVSTLSANPNPSARSVTLSISGSGVPEKTVTIQQAGNGSTQGINYLSYSIDDGIPGYSGNGNGVIERNEFVDLVITLNNTLDVSVSGVSAVLYCSETGINIITSFSSFENIAPGATKSCLNAFRIYVRNEAELKSYNISLDISTNENSFESNFMLPVVEAPNAMPEHTFSDQISIYPNPAKGWLNIKIRQVVNQGSIYITDMTNRMVVTQDIDSRIRDYNLDISHLEAGLYLIRIVSSELGITRKILVE